MRRPLPEALAQAVEVQLGAVVPEVREGEVVGEVVQLAGGAAEVGEGEGEGGVAVVVHGGVEVALAERVGVGRVQRQRGVGGHVVVDARQAVDQVLLRFLERQSRREESSRERETERSPAGSGMTRAHTCKSWMSPSGCGSGPVLLTGRGREEG